MFSNREAVLMILFDLPVKTKKQRRDYRRFRGAMLKQGFTMLQESVYFKILSNVSSYASQRLELSRYKPRTGNIQFLSIPLNSFLKMDAMVGASFDFNKCLAPVLRISDLY